MNGYYAIAYADKDGTGFSELKPWILDDFGTDLEGCKQKVTDMVTKGYQKVIMFKFGKRGREKYS